MQISNIYYINLSFDIARKEALEQKLAKQRLTAQRVEASSPLNTDLNQALREGIISLPFTNRRTGRQLFFLNLLRLGSLHCAISHIRLWKKISELPDNTHTLILEDDIDFHPDFNRRIDEHLQHLPRNYDIALFGYSYFVGTPVNKYFGKPKIPSPGKANFWFSSYLLNPKGAKRILNCIVPYNRVEGIDFVLKEHYKDLNVFLSLPRLTRQNRAEFGSTREFMNNNFVCAEKF